ncbi:hypothetical protein M0R72_15220 [Candidatus Pacearchaeota archaeon]|nr:hypothetical protein [Candidatus Pacearchaeota archaeon]
MGDNILLKIEIKKSEYLYPNSDDDKKADLLLYTILVTGSNGETNVYLMEESFWERLEPKLRKFVKKLFDSTQKEITKKELLK